MGPEPYSVKLFSRVLNNISEEHKALVTQKEYFIGTIRNCLKDNAAF